MSSHQRAVVIQPERVGKVVSDAPIPTLRPGYVKVKTVAVALNPTDWKHIAKIGEAGSVLGCDYAGIVEEIGPNVTKPVKVGDKIAGFVHGGTWCLDGNHLPIGQLANDGRKCHPPRQRRLCRAHRGQARRGHPSA